MALEDDYEALLHSEGIGEIRERLKRIKEIVRHGRADEPRPS